MNTATPRRNSRLGTAIGTVILLVGLSGSALVYLYASNAAEESSFEYRMEESMRGSKRFVHDMELYGGKTNLITSDFVHWFEGLWHGKQLAYTLAAITIFVSAAVFFLSVR